MPLSRIDEGLHRAGRGHTSGRASTLLLNSFRCGDESGVLQRLKDKERAA